jgi:hypothetical protein
MKKVIIAIALFAVSFFTNQSTANNHSANFAEKIYASKVTQITIDHTYEYIFKDGIWWVYEYDGDGRLVDAYPVED